MAQPQPYGQQPTQGHYPHQPVPTNGTAIAALVLSLLIAPIGLILSYVARSQIRRTGQGGAGIATAAMIVGWVFTAPLIILFVWALLTYVGVDFG